MARQPDLFAKPRPTLDELRGKYGPTWGIKIMAAEARRERELRHAREVADRIIFAEYAALGIDPVYASDGTLASPSLLRSINRMPRKSENAPVDHSDR
jgi:hypothetical protein